MHNYCLLEKNAHLYALRVKIRIFAEPSFSLQVNFNWTQFSVMPPKTSGKAPKMVPKGRKSIRTVVEKKRHKKNEITYAYYIYKVLKQVCPSNGISTKAMSIMNSFMNDMFERVAAEASRLANYNKRATITSREIQTSVRLILAGELAEHAVSEGTKAVIKYNNTKR